MKMSLMNLLPYWRMWLFGCVAAVSLTARADQIIYNDALQNSWQNWSWATANVANTSPVHSGSDSISVSSGAYQALYFENTTFDPTVYTNLSFWINGGSSGGQHLQIQAVYNGNSVAAGIAIGPLSANSWVHINAPLASLLPPGQTALNGFWLQENSGATLP